MFGSTRKACLSIYKKAKHQIKTFAHNRLLTTLSFGLLAIIFGFVATAGFVFFKALFGSDVGIKKDFTAAFMGAFFAFLFVRLGEGLTLIYKRKAINRNAMVRLQHHFNDCLNVLNDNIFVIDDFLRIFAGYSASQQTQIMFANKFQMIPIEKTLVVDLSNLDFINEMSTLHVDIRKLNDSMDTVNRMIEGPKEAFMNGRITHDIYAANIDNQRPRMAQLKKFLQATMDDIIKALASSNLLLKDKPILSTIMQLSSPIHYSSSHKKRLPDEIEKIGKEIKAVGQESEERIRTISS
jgi:hypothetical protein